MLSRWWQEATNVARVSCVIRIGIVCVHYSGGSWPSKRDRIGTWQHTLDDYVGHDLKIYATELSARTGSIELSFQAICLSRLKVSRLLRLTRNVFIAGDLLLVLCDSIYRLSNKLSSFQVMPFNQNLVSRLLPLSNIFIFKVYLYRTQLYTYTVPMSRTNNLLRFENQCFFIFASK